MEIGTMSKATHMSAHCCLESLERAVELATIPLDVAHQLVVTRSAFPPHSLHLSDVGPHDVYPPGRVVLTWGGEGGVKLAEHRFWVIWRLADGTHAATHYRTVLRAPDEETMRRVVDAEVARRWAALKLAEEADAVRLAAEEREIEAARDEMLDQRRRGLREED